ncbi:hypothetical protein [Terrabacter sp. RAF57]|uniref:hypothetical protein n=1 Tax=Terrabacter sp. RAF57 TaxID=3233063 RepID=UPI003F9E063D
MPADTASKSKEPSKKARAWAIFDRIVADAAPEGLHTNPWSVAPDGNLEYEPDFEVLTKLLGVSLFLKAETTTGVPALALDVWLAYEFRRAGFDRDAVWPRATAPRVLPAPVVSLLGKVTQKERAALWTRLQGKTPPAGAAASSANILGKNYLKQVDVVMSNWDTGPELLISTKRMDSSFGKNAANRVEESYGDAKNLRLRHPLAALGFVYGLRSTIFTESPVKAKWLIDLLQKLGREDDAYHAVSLLIIEYTDADAPATDADDAGDGEDALVEAGVVASAIESEDEDEVAVPAGEVETALANIPRVTLRHDKVPQALQAGTFMGVMIQRLLDATPVNFHEGARDRQLEALDAD